MTTRHFFPLVLLEGFKTEFYEGKAIVSDMQALGKLVGPFDCVAIIIKNRLMNLDNTANPLELMIGTGGGCVWPLLPGETSELIYVKNLNDVWVKVRTEVVDAAGTPGEIVTIAIAAAGAGYAVNDLVTVNSGNLDAVYKVATIGGGGAITALTQINAGSGYAVGGPFTLINNSVLSAGAGATVNITDVQVVFDSVSFPVEVFLKDAANEG